MTRVSGRLNRLTILSMIIALLFGMLAPTSSASAASGVVLFHLDGASNSYTDRTGAKTLLGTAQYSNTGRAFGSRLLLNLTSKRDASLGGFPYGAFGLFGTDSNGDYDYTDAGEVDPVNLMSDMRADGQYNLALSATLGRLPNEAEIIRILEGARDRNLKLIVRATELQVQSDSTTAGTQDAEPTSESLNTPDELLNVSDTSTGSGDVGPMAGSEVFVMNTTVTLENLQRLKKILTDRPDLRPVIYAWYAYDEPMQRNMTLSEMRRIYKAHKDVFPNNEWNIPIFTVFNQRLDLPDSNGDGITDGLLGQPENPYGSGVTDIVALNVYIAAMPNYNYGMVRRLYTHARRVVNKVSTSTPIWAVPQAHGLMISPNNHPEPHQLYRQVNDWLRAGPDTGLRGLDGLMWYSWHFPPETVQNLSDLEDNPANRQMARLIGERVHSGTMVTHKLPYRNELYLAPSPSSTIKAPRSGHLDLARGTITFGFSHLWHGADGIRHVLFDTGVSGVKNRMLIEKTSGNVLRFMVIDAYGNAKWTGISVDSLNMPGAGSYAPGYSDIAVTWSNGNLALYLDGVKGALSGGSGTGTISYAGTYIFLGTDVGGRNGANGTFSYVTIRNAAGTASEVDTWTKNSHAAYAPARVALYSPVSGTSTTDRTPTLSWYGVAGAVKYQVQISRYSNFSSLMRNVQVTDTTYTTPTGLTGGTTYYWRVRASDNYGWGAWSPYRSLKVR